MVEETYQQGREQALFEQYEEAKADYYVARQAFGEDDETTQYLRWLAADLYRRYLRYAV
jgi:ABC-type uncharacterized transport system YnjBCD substrate-binding protein